LDPTNLQSGFSQELEFARLVSSWKPNSKGYTVGGPRNFGYFIDECIMMLVWMTINKVFCTDFVFGLPMPF
jgi:hypothetical protein